MSTNPRREVAGRMAEAAMALVDSLDEAQRAVACWPMGDHDERLRWFYTPTDHGGLPLCLPSPGAGMVRPDGGEVSVVGRDRRLATVA